MGDEGLYSVGKGMRKSTLKKLQPESFMGNLRIGLTWKRDSSNSSMCFSCDLLWVGTREPVAS